MHSKQPLPRSPAPQSPLRRPISEVARTSGLYGEVMTLPVSRRELIPAAGSKALESGAAC
ncbi:MAG TPA: hypothetical protein VFF66_12790 [Brevundimonas sp.]|nr:hypothetical protein [Brevundimonas sp.]